MCASLYADLEIMDHDMSVELVTRLTLSVYGLPGVDQVPERGCSSKAIDSEEPYARERIGVSFTWAFCRRAA